MALIFKILVGLLIVDRGVMMIDMTVVVCILSVLFLTMAATVFCELPRNARDVFCFLVMLAVGVAVVLVFIVRGV
jgi:hypothetical protein